MTGIKRIKMQKIKVLLRLHIRGILYWLLHLHC